ncbi:MAG TPA: hypothetical protein VNF47_02195 [Streptosporangiaceae bacterium]|nr:hypothetical protein [Streptosporangiaceae bacterium]
MRLPEATGQVKAAPVRALRAVFAGIGQLLLAADRFRAEGEADLERSGRHDNHDPLRPWDSQHDQAGALAASSGARKQGSGQKLTRGKKPGKARRGGKSAKADQPARFRSLDSTGNVRLLTKEDFGTELTPQEPTPAPPETGHATTPGAGHPAAPPTELPVPGYDGLTVPSLRARLRALDVSQLQVLLEYEKANAGREDVVRMFERRITKLGATVHAT